MCGGGVLGTTSNKIRGVCVGKVIKGGVRLGKTSNKITGMRVVCVWGGGWGRKRKGCGEAVCGRQPPLVLL